MCELQAFAFTHTEANREGKTWNTFNSTSTYQHGVSLPTEFRRTWCSLGRVNYISLFSLWDFWWLCKLVNKFSTKASGVTLACCDRITWLYEVHPILKMPEQRTAEAHGNQRQSQHSLRETWNSDSLVPGTSLLLWHGLKVADKKMTAGFLRTAFALFFFFSLFGVLEATISCRNEEGKAVDW